MRVVLDTNILLSALMRDGFTRTLLLHPDLELVAPEYVLEEVHRHLPGIAQRMGRPVEKARLTMEFLLQQIETISRAEYEAHMAKADDLLKGLDPDDAPFAALAFATGLPIWTRDKALLDCKDIPTIATPAVARALGIGTHP